jgi:hypothetical protein
MKPLYYVAKILGIAPFTFKIDPVKNEETIDVKFTSNIGGFTASAVIFILLLVGFVSATFLPQFSFSRDLVDALCYVVSVPLNFFGSLSVVIMNSTVNRCKFEKLVNKLLSIDEGLNRVRRGYVYHREEKNVYFFMAVLVLVVVMLSYEVFLAVNRLELVYCVIERSSHLISLVAVMQYCKMALMIRKRLLGVHEALSFTFCNRLSHTNSSCSFRRGALKVYSQTSNILHVSAVDVFSHPKAGVKTVHVTEDQMILKLRRIYHDVFECCKIINFMYGFPILIYVFRLATGLTSILYSLGASVTRRNPDAGALLCLIWVVILLGPMVSVTVICDLSASKTKDITHRLQELLLKDNIRSEAVEQLKLFCHQISSDTVVFSAAGLFNVDLSLLCTFLTSVTTYIVVLIQLSYVDVG